MFGATINQYTLHSVYKYVLQMMNIWHDETKRSRVILLICQTKQWFKCLILVTKADIFQICKCRKGTLCDKLCEIITDAHCAQYLRSSLYTYILTRTENKHVVLVHVRLYEITSGGNAVWIFLRPHGTRQYLIIQDVLHAIYNTLFTKQNK